MKLYFTDGQVPEMAKLGASQRRVVRREAYKMFSSEHPSWEGRVRFVTLLAVFLGGFVGLAAHRAGSGWLLAVVVGGATAGATGIAFQSALTERLRPYFRQYLQEHGNDIEWIGEQDGGGKRD